jgi:hypothetical protein
MPERRDFLRACLSLAAAAGLKGCLRHRTAEGNFPGTLPASYPHLEVEGDSYQVGLAIGKRFGENIRQVLVRRREWFEKLCAFVDKNPEEHYRPFFDAVRGHFPDFIEELRGTAEGAGRELRDLVILNLAAELEAMQKKPCGCPGCSTLALVWKGNVLLAHNEDGDYTYADLMYTVRIKRPGKPAFFALVYPGILPGNAPVWNRAGMVMTTNFIGGLSVRPGVGRYFLSRAMCEVESLQEAVRISSLAERAYSFHFCIGSARANEILSVETCPERVEVQKVEGLYIHTNHLVLPTMRDIPQDQEYLEVSSMSRYRVLEEMVESCRGNFDKIDGARLIQMLSSHQGRPTPPCRHHRPPSRGVTLASALFDLQTERVRLYRSNPCMGRFTSFSMIG